MLRKRATATLRTRERRHRKQVPKRYKGQSTLLGLSRRNGYKLNPIFTRQLDHNRQFGLSLFEFLTASRKEAVKTTRHTYHDNREFFVSHHSWCVRDPFGKIDNVAGLATEHLTTAVYFDRTRFLPKCFIPLSIPLRLSNLPCHSRNSPTPKTTKSHS